MFFFLYYYMILNVFVLQFIIDNNIHKMISIIMERACVSLLYRFSDEPFHPFFSDNIASGYGDSVFF